MRQAGATPATVAVMNGKVGPTFRQPPRANKVQSFIWHACGVWCVCVQLCVGLESDQLEQLGAAGAAARKCSRRDIALSLADGGLGATTVAGTMYVLPFVLSGVFAAVTQP